jgi:hypothetical protein
MKQNHKQIDVYLQQMLAPDGNELFGDLLVAPSVEH